MIIREIANTVKTVIGTQYFPRRDVINYDWLLAPELDADVLTDVDGNILTAGDTVYHVDGGLVGTIYNIDYSPFPGEEHLLMAFVVWELTPEDGYSASDWIAGYLLTTW